MTGTAAHSNGINSEGLSPDEDIDHLFVEALRGNDIEQLEKQIKTVSDVDLTPADGRTALMFVAKRNRPSLVYALLDRGADPNASNANGGTPLMYAAIAGNVDIVKALVKAGGDIDARGSNGWSAVMVAAAKGHASLVSYLISLDVDVDAVDVYSWTPLIRASYENRLDVISVLIDSGQVQINHSDDQGATALHHAAGNGYHEIVERLLDANADLLKQDNNQLTAFDRAVAGNHDAVLQSLCQRLDSQAGQNSNAESTVLRLCEKK